MYDKLTYALVPSGYKANKLYSFVGGDMTFSRATTATRINKDGYVELVPTGVPRLNYPLVNGVPSIIPELLLEPARINLLSYSEDFTQWNASSFVTIDSNIVISPDGNNKADVIYEKATSQEHRVQRAASLDNGEEYTVSVWAKNNGRKFSIYSNPSVFPCSITFDFETETLTNSSAGATGGFEKYPNGWYRIYFTNTTVSAGTANIAFRPRDENNDVTYVGDITKGITIWGAQFELGNYPTSYIPTFDSTGSRNAELATGALADFNDNEGVLYFETAVLDNIENYRISVNNNDSSNKVELRYGIGTNRIYGRVASGTTQADIPYDLTDTTAFNKIAIRYQYNLVNIFVNGSKVGADTSANMPVGLVQLDFDSGTGADPFYGRVKQVLYFNELLTDSELETLTT